VSRARPQALERLRWRGGIALERRLPPRLAQALLRRPVFDLDRRYLRGLRGIEIGASAHNPYVRDAINVDRYASMDTHHKRHERRLHGRPAPVDVVAPGDDLPFPDRSCDFVLASHVIEHFPDPIGALEEWLRVSREYILLVVPHRDRTLDRDRPLTSIAELERRHRERFASEEDLHWSVWTGESFLELCAHLGLPVVELEDPDRKRGNGFAVVISAREAHRQRAEREAGR